MANDLQSSLEELLASAGPGAALERLAEHLAAAHRHHDRFDLRLLQARHRLGLPLISPPPLDELAEPARSAMEEASLAACREAGSALLAEGKLREAWMYLRPSGDREPMAAALGQTPVSESNLQELVELALYEGIAPALGFSLVLDHFGVCNAITTFESLMLTRPAAQQQAAAALLVQRVHRDLIGNVRADIARQENAAPREASLAGLIDQRDWLFAENNYHLDATHLHATVRFARLLADAPELHMARDIAAYGSRLAPPFQFAGDEPFVDTYPAHLLFFDALLGERVTEAVEYFTQRAKAVDPREHGTAAAEVLVVLLARLGRPGEALQAALELIPVGMRTSGHLPSVLELARAAGDFGPVLDAAADRQDWLTYLTAQLARANRR